MDGDSYTNRIESFELQRVRGISSSRQLSYNTARCKLYREKPQLNPIHCFNFSLLLLLLCSPIFCFCNQHMRISISAKKRSLAKDSGERRDSNAFLDCTICNRERLFGHFWALTKIKCKTEFKIHQNCGPLLSTEKRMTLRPRHGLLAALADFVCFRSFNTRIFQTFCNAAIVSVCFLGLRKEVASAFW